MFTLSGGSSGADMVLLAPMLGQVDDGPELEIVDFLRDDMACMRPPRALSGKKMTCPKRDFVVQGE